MHKYVVATFVALLIATVNAVSVAGQDPEVSIVLNKREYSYSAGEVIDGYFSVNRPSHVELWVQYPDQSLNLWISVDKPAGTYKFGKNASEIPRSALSPGYNLLVFRILANTDGSRATDSAIAWLKV